MPVPEPTAQRTYGTKSTEALVAELRDSSAEVAVKAAEALATRPAELAVPALREVVENRERYFDASTRAAAVHALTSLLPPGQGDLVAAAARDSDALVSLAAIAALVERDDADSANVLLNLLEDSSGFYIGPTRQAAARGLASLRCGDSGRVAALLQRESDPEVRQALAAC
jgi:HEAT repeat protein